MSINVFTKEDCLTSFWSGGKTTQLFIYPEATSLKEKNFDFRISTASIEVEESVFSPNPGFERKLMVLEGELLLQHENNYSKVLKTFEQDHFLGDWNTVSKGKVLDFNVIYKPEFKIELNYVPLNTEGVVQFEKIYDLFIYVFKGQLIIENKSVLKGDLVEIKDENHIAIRAIEECDLVIVKVNK